MRSMNDSMVYYDSLEELFTACILMYFFCLFSLGQISRAVLLLESCLEFDQLSLNDERHRIFFIRLLYVTKIARIKPFAMQVLDNEAKAETYATGLAMRRERGRERQAGFMSDIGDRSGIIRVTRKIRNINTTLIAE